jgi:hypothetical protein
MVGSSGISVIWRRGETRTVYRHRLQCVPRSLGGRRNHSETGRMVHVTRRHVKRWLAIIIIDTGGHEPRALFVHVAL